MGHLTSISPAGLDDCLEMGGSRALARKALLYQREVGDSIAFFDGEDLIAIAFLVETSAGELEFALSIRVRARARMTALCRIAHLTLCRLAETGAVVICHVSPGNLSGARMARLVGFSREGETRWKWSGRDGSSQGAIRRGQQGGEGGSRKEPAASKGRQ